MKRLALSMLIAAAACDAVFLDPVFEAELGVSLTVAEVSADGADPLAVDVDLLRLQLLRPDGFVRQLSQSVEGPASGLTTRIHLHPAELVDGLEVRLELLYRDDLMYSGVARLDGGSAQPSVSIAVIPNIERMWIEPGPITFDALGSQQELRVVAQFPTGDLVPGLTPSWNSLDPVIAAVTDAGVVTSIANGRTTVVAEFVGITAMVEVEVQQIAATISGIVPSAGAPHIGSSLALQPVGLDPNGRPLTPGAAAEWSAQPDDGSVLVVDSHGLALFTGPGDATVTVANAFQSASIDFHVPPLEAGEAWPFAAGNPEGLVVGDLAGNWTVLVEGPGAEFVTWAPDHSELAFVREGGLYRTDMEGNVDHLVGDAGFRVIWPEYTADGSWIIFERQVPQNVAYNRIYRIRPDGTGLEPISPYGASAPTSSPDGTRIAYLTRQHSGSARLDLQVMELGGEAEIVSAGWLKAPPTWSPDGGAIALIISSRQILGTIRPDGSDSRLYTDGHGFYPGVSWSPDGKWILGLEQAATLVSVGTGEMFDLSWRTGRHVAWWR